MSGQNSGQNKRNISYKDLSFPTYRNSTEIGMNFTVKDLLIAGILSGTNILLTGEAGEGKSQAMYDIERYFFGGSNGGNAISTRAHSEIDLYNELFKKLDIKEADIKLVTEAVDVGFYGIDELNRAPEVSQNQFLGLGDGIIEFKGKKYRIGKDVGDNVKYVLAMATLNEGNGEYGGTFGIDKALRDRMQLVIESTHPDLRPSNEEEIEVLDTGKSPSVEFNGERDLTPQILRVYKEIIDMEASYPVDGLATLYFLKDGLRQCRQNNDEKYKGFPGDCQDCDKKGDICYLVKPNSTRVLKALKGLSLGLAYVGMLKNGQEYLQSFHDNVADHLFMLYPFIANGKNVVNPLVLQNDFKGDEFRMLKEVADKLKEEYRKKEDYILTSVYYAIKNGKIVQSFAVIGDNGKKILDADELKNVEVSGLNYDIVEPFKDTDDLRWEWIVSGFIPYIIRKRRS